MGFIESVDSTDVAPITVVTIRFPGHNVAGEVVNVRLAPVHEIRDDVAAHVMRRVFVFRILFQRID